MKKILIIIPFLLLLLPTNVSAANFGDINVTIPAEMNDTPLPYYCIWAHDDYPRLMLSSEPQYFSGPSHKICIGSGASYVFYKLSNGSWELIVAEKNIKDEQRYNYTTYYHSNYDLKNDDGEVVFQKAPIKVSLKETMRRMAMGAVMKTVAKMVPTVMIAVVGFLGFRKAFNLLLRVFQGA